MKKSLLALAVLGAFAGAASAQSSITIYGSLDLAISKGNGGTAANSGANGTSRAYRLQQSNASRLGFRGNEDLGGGLSAQFQIEHRFTPDNGGVTAPDVFWFGRSYVQLTSSTLGSVYLGREYSPLFWVQSKSDPFGNDGVGQFGADISWAGFRAAAPQVLTTSTPASSGIGTASTRTSNTVGYKSPNFAGLTVNVATALGENVNSVNAAGGVTPRDDAFNVEYGAGPIYAAIGYERLHGGTAGTGNVTNVDGNSLLNAAFHYDLGMVKPIVYYARAKLGVNEQFTNKYWFVGALAPIGPGTLKAGYGRLLDETVTPGTEIKKQKFGIGYDYPLSKRTGLYADAGFGKQDNQSNNRAVAFGMKHTF